MMRNKSGREANRHKPRYNPHAQQQLACTIIIKKNAQVSFDIVVREWLFRFACNEST